MLPGGLDEVESVQEVGNSASPIGARQVVEVGHEEQVLLARQQVVDRGELAGHADQGAHPLRIGPHVAPAHLDLTGVRGEHRGEHVHGRRLAGAVRAEEREHRARRDLEVDPVEDEGLAVRLAQTGDLDGRRRSVGGHDSTAVGQVRCRSLPRRAA